MSDAPGFGSRDVPDLSWREVVEKHHAALADDLTSRLDSQLQRAVSHAIETERASAAQMIERTRSETTRATSEHLNQALRRLRQAPGRPEALRLLAESSSAWSKEALVLSLEGERAYTVASRGLASQPDEDELSIGIEDSPAIATAIESKDPVVAFASPLELSTPLAQALGNRPDRKVYLFPVLERQNATAMLIAAGDVTAPLLELLCEAVGMRLEALAAPAPALQPLTNPAFVQIDPAHPTTSASRELRSWNDLSPEDQQLHLKAQRAVRVRVAEIRLYQGEALRKGIVTADIYGALAPDIDTARTEFLRAFLSKSPTMVDYLHLEILRSLAHDDDRLLGEKYPGPMV